MKNKSVVVRLIGILIIIITISTLTTSYVVSNRIKVVLEEEIREEIFVILQSLDWAIRPLLEEENDEAIQRLIDNIAAYPMVESIRLHSADNTILFSNNPLEIGQELKNACVIDVFENNSVKKSREDFEQEIFEAAVPVRGSSFIHEVGNDIQAVLFVSADMDYILNLWNDVTSDFRLVFISVNIVLVIIIALYIYFTIGRPLLEFTKASNAISQKDYGYHIEGNLHGEFINLEDAYNQMRRSIRDYTTELSEAKAQAEAASEAKMIFLTNMSHEIRTPLNSILGFTEILEEKELDEEKRRELKIVHKSGAHLLTVINDLLDFSKIESERMEVESIIFSVRELVRDTSDFFRVQFNKKNIDYHYEISDQVPFHCRGDANKIRQILINLINNAIKFTKEGSIELFIDYQEELLVFTVKDTGIGISEDKLETIFNAFSQSDNSIARKYGGTGLGLAICKKFAIMLGGDIRVESALGQGSTFTVSVGIVPLKSEKLLGRGILCKWLNADSELTDLVYETLFTLPPRVQFLLNAIQERDYDFLRSEIHALKGLTGNFQLNELYTLFVSADKGINKEPNNLSHLASILEDIKEILDMVVTAAEHHCHLDGQMMEAYEDDLSSHQISTIPQKVDRELFLPLDEMDTLAKDSKYFTKGKKILLAEDILENQLLVIKILEPLDVRIDTANNGLEAMKMLKQERYDCLLLDVQMPEMSGEDVLNAIQETDKGEREFHKPHIIVITAHATLDEKNRVIGMGADDYLSKPVDKQKLRNKIVNLFSK